MKTHSGSVTISRITGDEQWIEIRIRENNSHIEFVTARLSLETFAKAITGHGYAPADLELVNLERVGWISEHKEEIVKFDGRYERSPEKRDKIAREVLRVFEIDGWVGDGDDLFNHHRSVQGKGQRVTFFRHVPPTEPAS